MALGTIEPGTQECGLADLPQDLTLTSGGFALDTAPDALGPLRSSAALADDWAALRTRMAEDGYLYLPGYLNRADVIAARREVTRRLADEGHLAPGTDPLDAIAASTSRVKFKPDLADNNPPLMHLLYDGPMMAFYAGFFGGDVRHFDFTWMRAVSPGTGTQPHLDIVFMGRGTDKLLTAWTPLGDIDYRQGGLIVLENSYTVERLKTGYARKDVDTFCVNHKDAPKRASGTKWWGGSLARNPVRLRERMGGRWLTTQFHAGDLLTFSMYTVHASLDNHSDRIRLSSDTRYQQADEAIDERWIGPNPAAHGRAGKRGRIC